MKRGRWTVALLAGLLAAPLLGAAGTARADDFETGPNVSGESGPMDHHRVLNGETLRKDDQVKIEVPRMPDGRPWRPVRGLSANEKRELNDLEYRFEQGQIGEAEYYSRRNAIMERIGLEAEY